MFRVELFLGEARDGLALRHNRLLCADALDRSVRYGLNQVGLG
jgi:hypothetical protein